MNQVTRIVLLVALIAPLAVLPAPGRALGQESCPTMKRVFSPRLNAELDACDMGIPNQQGQTVGSRLDLSDDIRTFEFRVGPEPLAAYIYVGDQWYNLAAGLYEREPSGAEVKVAEWFQIVYTDATGSRVLQFVRPEKIVKELKANTTYTLAINAPTDEGFDPRRGFTVRVALGPEPCGDPQRDSDDRYQLALALQPSKPGPFDLISFNAFVSPPYSDLFDYEWQVNGAPVGGNPRETIQRAASDFSRTPGSENRISVTARGARQYPDPAQPHIPPTLTVNCTFSLS